MFIVNRQMEACGFIKEEFNVFGDKIQEVLFCPIVNSFFPEKWKKEEMVKSIIYTIENEDPEYENSYILKYENEYFHFEFLEDHITKKQLIIIEVHAGRCFGYGVHHTIH